MKNRVERFITLRVNGKEYELSVGTGRGQVPPQETLANTLRDHLGLTGTKVACDEGACGCCTVVMNGEAVTSCMLFTCDCDGADITTIEGLADAATGELSGLQKAFLDNVGFQCGFCTPGIIMSAVEIVGSGKQYTREELRKLISGHLCRCTGYQNILNAVERAVNEAHKFVGK